SDLKSRESASILTNSRLIESKSWAFARPIPARQSPVRVGARTKVFARARKRFPKANAEQLKKGQSENEVFALPLGTSPRTCIISLPEGQKPLFHEKRPRARCI